MGFFDMFDKMDDIVYKPIETICDWFKEPLRKKAHQREMEMKVLDQKNKERDLFNEQKIKEMDAELDANIRRWNAEIDAEIFAKEDERRDKLVECVKNYQITMATARKEIIEGFGKMSLDMRERAQELVLEKTKHYIAIQNDAKESAKRELAEAKEDYAEDDPDLYEDLKKEIMYERRTMFDKAGEFITELSADIKRVNELTDQLTKEGYKSTNDFIDYVAKQAFGDSFISSSVKGENLLSDK